MKPLINLIVFCGIIFLSGCAAIPKQVVDAMEVQQQEIERVKVMYFNNMNNQLDAIEKYRLAILDIYEEQYLFEYSRALDMVTNEGKTELAETEPTGDKNVDHINLAKLEIIKNFFNAEREKIRIDVSNRREQINKANLNFENIEQVNHVVNDYMQSLVRLKNSRDKLAQAIKSNIEKMIPIPVSFDIIPDPSTIKDLVNNFKVN